MDFRTCKHWIRVGMNTCVDFVTRDSGCRQSSMLAASGLHAVGAGYRRQCSCYLSRISQMYGDLHRRGGGGNIITKKHLAYAPAIGDNLPSSPVAVSLGQQKVSLLQQHIPELVQVVPRLLPQVLSCPRPSCGTLEPVIALSETAVFRRNMIVRIGRAAASEDGCVSSRSLT